MTPPIVDVIIPVHTPHRPIDRATASVLSTATVDTRVTVVCHNVEPEQIAGTLGTWIQDSRVRLLHLDDGVPSPAGPINTGLDAATAEFTALLGSDDEYEPGAIDAWVNVARRDGADIVIPPLRTSPDATTRSPPVRPGRTHRLNGVRDRLAYRTVQLGLVSRQRFGAVRMTSGLTTGEDVIQGASLWYSNATISLARGGPGYLIHQDNASDSASRGEKPASASLGFLDAVLAPQFFSTLTPTQRESFAIKLLRTHIMDILSASLSGEAPSADLADLSGAVQRIVDLAPTATLIMSRREVRIIRELVGARHVATLTAELAVLTDYRRPANLIPASPWHILHREAMPRFLTAIALMR
jgi:hypothetical protein